MAIILVASKICITLKLQLKKLAHGLHIFRSIVSYELHSIQLRVLAILLRNSMCLETVLFPYLDTIPYISCPTTLVRALLLLIFRYHAMKEVLP